MPSFEHKQLIRQIANEGTPKNWATSDVISDKL